MSKLWNTEPAAVIGVASAVLDVVSVLAPVSPALHAALVGLITSIGALFIRSQVTPASPAS